MNRLDRKAWRVEGGSLTAVSEQSSGKVMLMVKSRFERQSGSVLGARSRRAEKKPISSPVAHLSLSSPSPFPLSYASRDPVE